MSFGSSSTVVEMMSFHSSSAPCLKMYVFSLKQFMCSINSKNCYVVKGNIDPKHLHYVHFSIIFLCILIVQIKSLILQ